MAQLLDYIEYLTKDVGARPAGTEEEQEAALYITEQFQKEAGFPATMEEFVSSSNFEFVRAICSGIVVLVAVLAIIFPVLAVPAFILAFLATLVYALEAFDKPFITKLLARGASQNVVAKYQPSPEGNESGARGRSRKIVLVAHYDSGKVVPPVVERVQSSGAPMGLVCLIAMGVSTLFLMFRVILGDMSGALAVFFNIISVLVVVVAALPLVKAIMMYLAPYNEGANNNATGVAALIEVANRIGSGSVSEAELASEAEAEGVAVHGESAAVESGLVPEGAELVYEAERQTPPDMEPIDEEERLLSAKAAIAALTGQPVEPRIYAPININADAVNEREWNIPEESPEAVAKAQVEWPEIQPVYSEKPTVAAEPTRYTNGPSQIDSFQNAPSWFISAQQKAKRPEGNGGPIHRSRYADAIEAAEREAAERERLRHEEERVRLELELRAREQATREALAAYNASVAGAPAPAPEEPAPEELASESLPAEAEQFAAMGTEQPIDVEALEPTEAAFADAEELAASAAEPAVETIDDEAADDQLAQEEAEIDAETLDEELAGEGEVDDALADETLADEEAADGEAELPAEVEVQAAPARRFDNLPQIDAPSNRVRPNDSASPSRSSMFRKLRTDVPSMSGVIRLQEAGEDVSQTGPARSRRRPAIDVPQVVEAPLVEDDETAEDELLEQVEQAPADAQAAVREGDYAEEDYAEEDYAEDDYEEEQASPFARLSGFFDRFRRKHDDMEEETPQQWLDVDDDFEARKVGRKRGSWESFRDDSADDEYEGFEDDFEEYDDYEEEEAPRKPSRPSARKSSSRRNRNWEGGAFSRVRLGHVDMHSSEDGEADEPEELIETSEDQALSEEIEQIYHFRNPAYNDEIWFVAIGSDTDAHDGAKAFLKKHADELRGAMIIEVESLGEGTLSIATAEGMFKRLNASSRVKRFIRKASAATGIKPGEVSLVGYDSIASTVQAAGFQAMHLFGAEKGRPALKGSADDVMENIDENLLEDNVNFLMELLKNK